MTTESMAVAARPGLLLGRLDIGCLLTNDYFVLQYNFWPLYYGSPTYETEGM